MESSLVKILLIRRGIKGGTVIKAGAIEIKQQRSQKEVRGTLRERSPFWKFLTERRPPEGTTKKKKGWLSLAGKGP